MATVSISPNECDIGEANFPNGHFWRMQFVDPTTGDVANIVFTDQAFFDFTNQIAAVRKTIRN